ncbi:MAG: DISARM system helicase DrmA [Myxococcales bacterium]|nr:DISARM system helicase DrmA [Myxococcales bacterium]
MRPPRRLERRACGARLASPRPWTNTVVRNTGARPGRSAYLECWWCLRQPGRPLRYRRSVSFVTSAAVRSHLVRALEADLVGPYEELEELDRAPSRTYLTGFLVPREDRAADPLGDPDDDVETEEAEADGEEEATGGEEERPAGEGSRRPQVLPASMGLSVLIPPGTTADQVTVVLRCAEYEPFHPEGVKKTRRPFWRRKPHPAYEVVLPLDAAALVGGTRIPALTGVSIEAKLGESSTPKQGTRALSVFVVNRRAAGERGRRDAQMLFQVSLEVRYEGGFLARPALRRGSELDDLVASLQYRGICEYAVGHGVGVEAPTSGKVTAVTTTWLPRSEVRRVATSDKLGDGMTVERGMRALSELTDGDAVRRALGDLPTAYGKWIEERRRTAVDKDDRDTLDALVRAADDARGRIAAGIELLATSAEALEAFTLANRAMADQARQRLGLEDPQWRLFQLAFVLLCLPSVTDEAHDERSWVELIFFPTGGGKTEAYLGVIAYALLLRRMRGQGRPDGGLGVAVILRYTLRLLTLDQYERATTLMCALELLRRAQPARLGDERFAVGLWVGASATSNTMLQVKTDLGEYRKGTGPSPCPLARCPWCKRDLTAQGITLDNPKKPTAVVVGCENDKCEFSPATHRDGIPVVFVDEQVYRELPAFIVATVDKFAMVPWRAETGMLFGRVAARVGRSMIEPGESVSRGATRLPHGLRQPELIVQDELHLISGPLGTMVGLYETAIEELCARTDGDRRIVPKVIASTATVRRAAQQVQALMGRATVRAFPPQGPDPGETFFAAVDEKGDGRLYLGVAAPGRAFRAVQARVYQTLLAAAQFAARDNPAAADPYLTLVGYFNALRELGAMRRVVEDEVPQRTLQSEKRRPLGMTAHPYFAARTVSQIVELTSRESTAKVKDAKDRLGKPFASDKRVDVVLASNMISVGVDIDRLGLMVVAGQPTTSAEYIQASSRVGRDHTRPGLVVTCYNVRRVRDRSFFERFAAFHQSFYGWVEATSVTPFSQPALDRALAGVLIAMVRHGHAALAPARGAMEVPAHGEVVERAIAALVARASMQHDADAEGLAELVRARARDLADAWNSKVAEERDKNIERGYSPFDLDRKGLGAPMLLPPGERPIDEVQQKFAAPTSMRDTEPTVHLWLRYALGRKTV